jgi:hypothetical protein
MLVQGRGGKIQLPGLAVGCSVRTAVPAQRHSPRARIRIPVSVGTGLVASLARPGGRPGHRERWFNHHCCCNNGDSNQDLTRRLMEKLIIRQLFERFPLTTLLDEGPRGGHGMRKDGMRKNERFIAIRRKLFQA